MDTSQSPTPDKDFSADLQSDTETVTDVNKSTHDFLWKRHPVHSFFTIIFPLCLGIPLTIYFASISGSLGGAVFWILLFVSCLIPGASYWNVRGKIQILFYTELAASLGCTFTQEGEVPTDGQLFLTGGMRSLINVLSGKYASVPFWIADYSYVVQSGKNSQTIYYTVAQLTFGGALPRIYCHPSRTFDLEFIGPPGPAGFKKLPLEGDFDSKFSVYVPEGQEIEGLQILEPNVMTKLMDNFERYGFECVGTHVYLFTRGVIKENRGSVLALYSLVQRFYNLLTPELQSFLREPPTT